MRKVSLAIAFALLFAGIAYSQAPPPPSLCSVSSISNYWQLRFGNWADLCALGIIISFLTISVLYMLSQAFGKQGLAAWCKNELYQVFVTAIILGGLFGFVNFTCMEIKPSMFIALPPPPPVIPDDMFGYSEYYLKWLRDSTYASYYVTTIFNGVVSGVASVYVFSSPGGFGVALRPLSGLTSVSQMLTFVMNTLLVGALMPTMAQIRMLHVISRIAFNVFLPIGMISRCFEPTRRFGGSLIAIAIGLYIFYPFLLVLNAGMVQGGLLSEPYRIAAMSAVASISDPANPLYYEKVLSPDATNVQYQGVDDPCFYANSTAPGCPPSNKGFEGFSGYSGILNVIYVFGLRTAIAALFLPLLNFILLVTFILNLSRLLGEEVDVTSITRMI